MSIERLERNTRTVSLLTLVSRATGLARDAALSRSFGIGPVMDAMAFAFMLPNLFRRLFGEGALSAAFVPVFGRLERSDPIAAARLAALLVATLVVALGVLTLLGELLLWLLLRAGSGRNLTLELMMITLPYMPLVCLVAILGAVLQVRGKFGPTAAAPILLNLCIVAAALGSAWLVGGAAHPDSHAADPHAARAVVVSGSIAVAGVIQVVWSFMALRGAGIEWLRPARSALPHLREVLVRAGPMILGLGVLQLNSFIDGLIASWPSTVGSTILGVDYPLDRGALAALGYAQRLYEFPLGVFGVAVATAIFPLLSRQAHDPAAFLDTLRRGLRLVLFIGMPASAGLMLAGGPLTATLLQGGDFDAADTARVTTVLLGYAPAIWAYSMNHTLTRGLYALGDTMTPVRISIGMVVLNLLLNLTLIWTPLREAGLAWSTALCAMIQVVLLLRAVRSRAALASHGPVIDAAVRRSWGRTSLATGAMAVAVGFLILLTSGHEQEWSVQLGRLAAAVVIGMAVFAAVARLQRMEELRWALGRL
jgi:putative peptidoglycan lipid II flippase